MLLDPYAPLISGRRCFGVRDEIEEFEEKVLLFDIPQLHMQWSHVTAETAELSADLVSSASVAHADHKW